MNEPRKLAIVIIAIMLLAIVAYVIERAKDAGRFWLALTIASIAALILALSIQYGRAHDHSRPELNDWLKSLHSQDKTWCCNGDDTDEIDDWETKGGGYRVKFRGQWFDVPDGAIVDGPNRAGQALLWMNKGYSGLAVRCFKPGSMT